MAEHTRVLTESGIILLKDKIIRLIRSYEQLNPNNKILGDVEQLKALTETEKTVELNSLLDDIINSQNKAIVQGTKVTNILQQIDHPNRYLMLNYWPNKYINLDKYKIWEEC